MKRIAFCISITLLISMSASAQSKRRNSSKSRTITIGKILIDGVRVNDFYRKNIGSYGDTINLVGGTNAVQFDKNRSVFQITVEAVSKSDFKQNRRIIEAQFLNLLGITKADACRLKVEETKNSPGGWDGATFGLSFCK